jgi:carbamoyl-phosphate synthase large subunit
MRRRLLITGAGSGASNNLIRSLRSADASLHIVGVADDRFQLKKSTADRNYLVPRPSDRGYVPAIQKVTGRERVDLIVPTGDADVKALSDARRRLPGKLFLPTRSTIELCQDKYRLTRFLARHRLPVATTYPVTGPDAVERVFTRLGPRRPLWCRARFGSRSLGATPVTRPSQARAWMQQWAELRGVPVRSFILSEYLPGRDFLCQSVWKHGRMVLCSTFERIAYFGGDSNPGQVSSLSALAKTVVDDRVVDLCRRVIAVVEPGASGAFSIDLKENAAGVPCVTEINAGRFFIGMTAFDSVLKHNMPLLYVRLAGGEAVGFEEEYNTAEEHFLVRDLDTLPGVFHARELFEEIESP